MAGAQVRVLRVLSEDPWKADLLLEESFDDIGDAFATFDALVMKYESAGWECDDYGAAAVQLCYKNSEKRMIGLWLDEEEVEE